MLHSARLRMLKSGEARSADSAWRSGRRLLQAVRRTLRLRALEAEVQRSLPREGRGRDLVFIFSVIALAAKLARADGVPNDEEFFAFRALFPMPAEEYTKLRHLFDLAVHDTTHAEEYARRLVQHYPKTEPANRRLLASVLERLCKVAAADHPMVEREAQFLEKLALGLGFSKREWKQLLKQSEQGVSSDPYQTLGVDETASDAALKRRYYHLLREHHPDAVQARGGSHAEMRIAEQVVAAYNEAYTLILQQRGRKKNA